MVAGLHVPAGVKGVTTMAEITWRIEHYLKDGTKLEPGMQFPDTPENRATIMRAIEAGTRGGDHHDGKR